MSSFITITSLKVAHSSTRLYLSVLDSIFGCFPVWNYHVSAYVLYHKVIDNLIRRKSEDDKLRWVACCQRLSISTEHNWGRACNGSTCLREYSVVVGVFIKKHKGGCFGIKVGGCGRVLVYVCVCVTTLYLDGVWIITFKLPFVCSTRFQFLVGFV